MNTTPTLLTVLLWTGRVLWWSAKVVILVLWGVACLMATFVGYLFLSRTGLTNRQGDFF